MKVLILFSILFSTFLSQAATRSMFLPDQALIIIQSVNMETGELDSDPYDLYDLLNVPVVVGPSGDEGKILESYDKKWTLICAERKSSGTKQCQVIVRSGAHSKIDLLTKSASFQLQGVDAGELFQKFQSQKNNEFEFTTSDRALKIIAHPDEFIFEYSN